MKKTKIICTLGPASNNEQMLIKLIKNGMNVARVNMSHGEHSSHKETIDLVKRVREKLGVPVSILVDTKGPEIRLGKFEKPVELKVGQLFTICKKEIIGTEKIASVREQQLVDEINVGDKIFANNGMLVLKVVSKSDEAIVTKVLFGGKLSSHKGLNVPHIHLTRNFVSEADKKDLLFAIENDVEYIAASFVSDVEDLMEMKNFLNENGGENIAIIAKIENAEGVKNIDDIAKNCEGIMIARGDLGVEIPLEKIPPIQKKIIRTCNKYGKISIVATEMLESMTSSIRPTRAEVSDVAGAVFERACATMLSGETAVGKHPDRVVKVMSKVISEAEKSITYDDNFIRTPQKTTSISDSVANSTCKNAISLNAAACCVYTETGLTANLISRYRIKNQIIALTPNKKTYQQLALSWNTTPILTKNHFSEYEMIENAKEVCSSLRFAKNGDIIILVVGTPNLSGKTNTIKIINL